MKKTRNMVYSNTQSGGYFNPMMNYNYMTPSGFQGTNNYMAYGPNVIPGMMPNQYDPQYEEENYEQRISKLERQVRKLETRVSKLESSNDIFLEDTNNNMYMV